MAQRAESSAPSASALGLDERGLVVDDAFARTHAAYVSRLVRRMGVPASDVDDATQEVFLAALRRAETFEPGRSPRAWLFGIARHCARKIYRGARSVSLTDPAEPVVAAEQELLLERKRARSMVHGALDALPEAQRDVVILHKLEGWPMPVVAEAVGCSVATAQSRYRLGRIHIERIIRGRVARARMAGAMTLLAALFGWNAPTAAAAAVALCLVGGGYLLARPTAGPQDPSESPAAATPRSETARVAGAARPSGQEAPTAVGTFVVDESTRSTGPAARPANSARTAAQAPTAGEALAVTDSSGMSGPSEAAAAEAALAPAAAPASTVTSPLATPPLPSSVPPAAEPPTDDLEAWAEEGRLLRRARQLAATDRAAARALLSEYQQRFPMGRLSHEAGRLAETLGM